MPKLRKILGAILALSLFIFLLYRPFGLIRLPFIPIEAYEAIPSNTLAFFENDCISKDQLDTLFSKEILEKDALFQQYEEDQMFIKGIFSRHADFNRQVLQSGKMLTAIHHGGTEGIDFLHVLDQYEGAFDIDVLLDALKLKKIRRSAYRGTSIYTLYFSKGRRFVISQYRNLILLAQYPLIIEDAIEQLKTPHSNLLSDWTFRKLRRTKPENQFRLFFNLEKLPEFLLPFVGYEMRKTVQQLPIMADWMTLDIGCTSSLLKASGVLYAHESNQFLNHISNGENSTHHQTIRNLPDHAALVLRMDAKEIFNAYEKDLDADFSTYILPWLEGEMIYTITEPYSSSYKDEQFLMLKSNDIKVSEKLLDQFAELSGELDYFDYQTYKIQRIMTNNIFDPIMGEALNLIQNPFITQIEDYILFGNSRQAMEVWLDKYIAGQTLSRDVDFLASSLELSESSGMFLYIQPEKIYPVIKSAFKSDYQKRLDTAFEQYQKISNLRFQFIPQKGKFELEACMSYQPKVSEIAGVMWKTALKVNALTKPNILRNPETGEQEILVQDISYSIYLLNRGGDILWSKPMDGPILSDIHQIDYYHNGSHQFLFNTADGIHLLNREGENINEFPIQMQSPISNGLTVVDFDGLESYGYFVACENGNLYGFEANGRPLTGWNPCSGIGLVYHPLKHFERKGKDYIAALNDEGALHVFKKDGSRRFAPKSFDSHFISPLDFQANDISTRIVAADQQGTVRVVNVAGNSFDLPLTVGENKQVQFAFVDIAGDSRKDYIVLSESEMATYSYEGKKMKKLFEYQFEEKQDFIFEVEHPKENEKDLVGTYSSRSKEIFLIDQKGEPLPHFPLAGTTSFELTDLFDDNSKIIVVAFEDQLYAYKID